MNARRMPSPDGPSLRWPPSGDEVDDLLAHLYGRSGNKDRCAAWYVQVSTRTARRWRDPRRTASSIPFAAWTMLACASGLGDGHTLPIGSILPGVSTWDKFERTARERLEEAISSTLRRRRWRPAPDLVALLVTGADGGAGDERGVRATARALRVEPSTVLRWIDIERPTSAVPYAAWVMLLARERSSTLDRALVAPRVPAAGGVGAGSGDRAGTDVRVRRRLRSGSVPRQADRAARPGWRRSTAGPGVSTQRRSPRR